MSEHEEEEREHLEAERDFLMKSLDDLEAERAAGGIDEESYVALHDDYTARAAAVLRTLRDGVDLRPAPPAVTWRRRAVAAVTIAAVAVGSGVALAGALGGRSPGQTSSGNTSNQPDRDPLRELEAAVEDDPSDVVSRLLLARFLEADGELADALEQYDAVLELDAANVEALTHSGRVLYNAATQSPDQAGTLVDEAKARLDLAVATDPAYPDARFFRAIVLAYEFQDFAAAEADLQQYLALAPDGQYVDDVRDLLADVVEAQEPRSTSTT